MARSSIFTRLPLDLWAQTMSLPGWLLNQVQNDAPNRAVRGVCDGIFYQSGYFVEPNKFLGRDALAQAIATAEERIIRALSYSFTREWNCDEEIQWPQPRHGYSTRPPILTAHRKYFVEGGRETWFLEAENVPVNYSDPDGDTMDEWATIEQAVVTTDPCEIVIVPHGMGPDMTWAIRPLSITISGAGLMTATGWKWQFVEPRYWLLPELINLSEDDKFIQGGIYDDGVDVYRRYNNPANQAQIVWRSSCTPSCQDACIQVVDHKLSQVRIQPATYDDGDWTYAGLANCESPISARLWYKAGFDADRCMDCVQIDYSMRQAIVRLANVYLPDSFCACSFAQERFRQDREEMDFNALNVGHAMAHFGSAARGAAFAYGVVKNYPPIGSGG